MVLSVLKYIRYCPCLTDLCAPFQKNQGAYVDAYHYTQSCSGQKRDYSFYVEPRICCCSN